MATAKNEAGVSGIALWGSVAAIGATAMGLLLRGVNWSGLAASSNTTGGTDRRDGTTAAGEHTAPDLALDRPHPGSDHRAPEAFRPDPTAVPTADELDSLRPATGPAPAFAADRNTTIDPAVG